MVAGEPIPSIRRPRPRRDSQCGQSQVAALRNRDSISELPVIP
jgi:hypothetical protein